jgi:hypothetical protein
MMKPVEDRTAHRISQLRLPLLVCTLAFVAPRTMAEEPKTLRRGDKVIVQTDLLKALPTRHTSNLRLFSARDGTLTPIDYRFNARTEEGVVDSEGRHEFFLDDDDELVFFAKDTGDKVGAGAFPLDCDAAMEIIVSDPISGDTGWAYVLHFPGRPAKLPWDRSRRNDKI